MSQNFPGNLNEEDDAYYRDDEEPMEERAPEEYDEYVDREYSGQDGDGGVEGNGDAMEQDERPEYYNDNEDSENGDAMTWETLSTISQPTIEEMERFQLDEWFPMSSRDPPMPNFALPTLTRNAILNPSDILDDNAENGDLEPSPEEADDAADEAFQAYLEVMRPNPTRRELAEMVLDYFLYHGHSEVIETYCREMDLPLPLEAMEEMNVRNDVKADILEGNMELVLEKLHKISPSLMDDENVNFAVRKQHIIEMIRAGDTHEPVEYFRTHLLKDEQRPSDERMDIIEKIFTVMVVGVTETSEYHSYMSQEEREVTAKEVNSAMLHAMGKAKSSRIDLLAKSLVYLTNEVLKPQMSSVEVAEMLFAKPYGFQELLDLSTNRYGQVDLSQDLC